MKQATNDPQPAAKQKILFVVNDSWFFVSHRLPVAEAAIAEGYTVELAALEDETTALVSSRGIGFHNWQLSPRSTGVIREFAALRNLYKIIKRSKPDILHLVTIKGVLYGGVIARLLGVRNVVFAISGMGRVFTATSGKERVLQYLARLVYKFVLGHRNSSVIVQNDRDRQLFVEYWKVDPARVISSPGSGVDLDQFKPLQQVSDPAVVLFASRMLWAKGVETFVEAARQLKSDGSSARFILAGDTDPENDTAVPVDVLQNWHDEGIVEWIGHVKDMPALMAEASVFVLPTVYGEGIPKVLLEASAAGRAIVATDWPGCTDVVDDSVNGLLVATKDPEQLSQALKKLLDAPELARKFGQAGRLKAEELYSVETVVKLTLAVYATLLASSSAKPNP